MIVNLCGKNSVSNIYPPIELPCGGEAWFDHESGISFRCIDCFAVVGSVGMPRDCKEIYDRENNKKEMWEALSK